MKRFETLLETEATRAAIIGEADISPATTTGDAKLQNANFDPVGFIMDYESGQLSQDEIIAGFQKMLDSKLINHLQGHYQRTAQALLQAGHIHLKEADKSVEITNEFQRVMTAINSANSVQDVVNAVDLYNQFRMDYAPVPDDMVLPFKKVLTTKALELNVVPELAKGSDVEWQKLAPFLGSILAVGGISNPGN